MKNAPIKSAERTLYLFELFSVEQRAMTVTEISSAMGMPQSSTSVLLNSLVTLGYLEQDKASRTYYPTLRIAMLGTWMRRRHTGAGKVPRLLSKVAETTGESSIVAIRNGIYAHYILGQDGADPLRLHVESGHTYPLACCAVGWALLTPESDKEIGKIIRRTQLEAPRDHWKKSATSALENIRRARKHGYAQSQGEIVKGASAIAVLLPAVDGKTIAAGVGGAIHRIEDKKEIILEALHEFADAVTNQAAARLISANNAVAAK